MRTLCKELFHFVDNPFQLVYDSVQELNVSKFGELWFKKDWTS